MLDPERLTYAQWFWVCFALVLAVFFACRCIDLNYSEEPLTNEKVEWPKMNDNQNSAPGAPQQLPAQQR